MLKIAEHAQEYAALTRVLLRHGGSSIAKTLGLKDDDQKIEPSSPEMLAADIESLGPAYIKLAQVASTRGDMLPGPYADALERLQDDVEPADIETIRETIEEELGAKVGQLFSEFDERPMACASLGQVHRATLRDGRAVVVKVQRPDVDEEARSQLDALRRLAGIADSNTDIGRKFRFGLLLDSVEYALEIELDYRKEARNLQQLAENLSEFNHIAVPLPIPTMVARRVLVMEHISGVSLRDVSGVVINEIDTNALAEQIVESYLKQILIDGLFHADPHPGNLLLTDDRKLGLIDGGMVVAISPKLRRTLAKLLIAVCEQQGEEAAQLAVSMGVAEDGFEMDAFVPEVARIVANNSGDHLGSIPLGATIIQLLNVGGEHGLILPFEMTLFGKAMLQVENTIRSLSPQLDIRGLVRGYSARLVLERAGDIGSISNLTRTALESAELASLLPRRLNRITELIADNALRVDVNAIDEDKLLAGFQKVANRITAGLVVSALIVGASLIMDVDFGPSVFGIPVIAGSFFLVAACMGVYLGWQAMFRDEYKH